MNDRFLKACLRQPVDRTPVWFMRQAGRYMAEYQAIRRRHSILEVCKTPALAAEVTLQPINRFNLDAAIIFADILLPLEAMGLHLEFVESKGPVIDNPIRDEAGIVGLRSVDGEVFGYAGEAIRCTLAALENRVPLIGFAGAPFTLASYAIEGGSSRDYARTKQLMFSQPIVWHQLLSKLSAVVIEYLRVQSRAGAQAIQLFDSWVGALSPGDYEEYVLPHVQSIIAALRVEGIPIIYFGTGTTGLFPLMRKAGSDVLGVDWRVRLDEAWRMIGYDTAIQGNLDPLVLFAPEKEIERRIRAIFEQINGRPGHIFNLGHGILPQTPLKNVEFAIDCAHRFSSLFQMTT
ncbi:MAG: uroporphyrinogen decarboxylase [Nitrospira sp.]|nr:uroporphyrinogen decarboxylase [Nitrospira sp.]MCB9712180.1 uroporphyrinogen decarboxylase [Nitrospiraceae bacterium]MDR4488055.1 uroporphyrinogen decarboxylase [Nitrospirales bacterium]MCA9465433.1 uroporphyrinogen decarboxylase [Nitrospira sp.]MCA9475029.1 uroporphyrinogen decarboxylase [Nitrospira sp.]